MTTVKECSITKYENVASGSYLVTAERRKLGTKLTFFRYSATLEETFCAQKSWTESVKAIANTLLLKSERYFVAYDKNIN